jgi:hypothetical protein
LDLGDSLLHNAPLQSVHLQFPDPPSLGTIGGSSSLPYSGNGFPFPPVPGSTKELSPPRGPLSGCRFSIERPSLLGAAGGHFPHLL